MKKILVYGLSNNWGGVEAIVMNMIHRLAGNFSFDIIHSPDFSSYEAKYESEFVHFIHIHPWGENRKAFASALKKLMLTQKFDYVWVNCCIMANKTIISVVRKYSNAKIITHSHGSSFEENNKIKRFVLLSLHWLNKNYYLRNVDYPCMCSVKSGKWFYGKKFVYSHNVHSVKNGVETAKFKFYTQVREEYRRMFGITNEFLLFHAGRLTEVKNQRKILSVVADALVDGMNVKLIIAGDGELRNSLDEYAKELGIQKSVSFLGNRDDIANIYQAADVMLLPSLHEGFPVTLVEAQTSGLPCLVSDKVSNETNIVGLVHFLAIDEPDNRSWIEALRNLQTANIDRNETYHKVYAAGYDIENVCNEFIEFISK